MSAEARHRDGAAEGLIDARDGATTNDPTGDPKADSGRIRLVTEQDAAALADIYRPIVESTAISFET